jgi:methylaspartate mutase epsilon subunit
MSGATQVITKTTNEAVGIPTMEANAAGVRATKKAIAVVRGRRMPVDDETRLEMDMIQKEAVSIVDKVLELGDGDPAVGAIRGFEAGVVDVPWAPNENCKGRIIPIRDANGAVRYLSTGDLPFPRDVLEFNQQRIEERAAKDGKPLDVELAMFDIQEICQAC